MFKGCIFEFPSFLLRWLNRVMQDHEARASDLNRKFMFSFFLLFSGNSKSNERHYLRKFFTAVTAKNRTSDLEIS